MRLLAICLLAVFARADDRPDLPRIVGRAVAILDMNWEDSLAYTWKEKRTFQASGSTRKLSPHSMTYEVVLLEGLHYFKPIEREGRPLSGFEQKQELERMRDEGEKRRDPKYRPEKYPLKGIPFPGLADDYDLKLVEEDSRRWIIDGRQKYKGKNPPPREPFETTKFRMVVDRAESQIIRMDLTQNHPRMEGVATILERGKAIDHIWMWTRTRLTYPPSKIGRVTFQMALEMEYDRSDFRKH
jgi:hypothetical protein